MTIKVAYVVYFIIGYFSISLVLMALQTIFSVRADIAKHKAHKALQKGFHVEFINMETDTNLNKVAEEMSKRLEKVTK